MTDAWVQSNVSAVLLAAGLSSRMGDGRDKLLLPFRSETLLERAVRLLDSVPFYEKILVVTPERLERLILPPDVKTVVNPCPQDGQSASLKLGISAATGACYLFLMADQPLLTAVELRRLLDFARENPDKIVYPAARGVPASPCLFPSRFRGELSALSGDTGGRAVRISHPEDCLPLEAENPQAFWDVDSREDYLRVLELE